MDDKGEIYPDPEGLFKKNNPQQLCTDNMYTYDVDYPICTV